MKRALSWFAANGVAANLLLLVIVVGGFFTLITVKMEIFPELDNRLITVTVEYLGSAPAEVEESICVKVEEELQGIDGVEEITSTSSEGVGTVMVELLTDADSSKALDDIKSRVDAIDTFPEEAEKPIIQELSTRVQVINLAIAGDTDMKTLKFLGEQVRDEISALPGITQVKLTNAKPYEISIEVSEEALRRYGLTFDFVANAVRRSSLDLPGGSLKTEGGDILLRTKGQAYRGPEFEELALLSRPDGTRLTLGDVATVVDGFEDTDQSARFDGKPAVVVQVFRVGEQNVLDVAEAVEQYVQKAQQRLPEGISVTTWQDGSQYFKSRRDLLLKNALYGLILVFLILALFMRFRLAMWVSVGIPISFLGAIWLMPALGVSLNMISLFAFILVLGIVVDDAIVVGESIYTYQGRSADTLEAAKRGVYEVSTPVVFAVLTSVAAMVPLLNVSGTTGQIMRVIPLIVIPALLFSLVESLFVLPSHLSHRRGGQSRSGALTRWQRRFANLLEHFIHQVYRPFLEKALEWRYLTLSIGLAVLILTVGLVAGGRILFIFFPKVDADYVVAMLTMPQGTPAEVTTEAIKNLEESARAIDKEIKAASSNGDSPFKHVLSSIGEQPQRALQAQNAGRVGLSYTGSHLGEVTIELTPAEQRPLTSQELIRRWREKTGSILDARELTFTSSIFSPGNAIEIRLSHRNLDQLQKGSEKLKALLTTYTGVFNITDSHEPGKMELKIHIRPEAEALGLTLADLANQVRQGFYGEEAQRIQRGRDDIRVMVRYPEEKRRSLSALETMRIRTADGFEVPFAAVADVRFGRGYASIQRANRRRTITVTADVDEARGNANQILNDLQARGLPKLMEDFPGLIWSFEGQRRDQQITMRELLLGFALALFIIYALLAVPFKSYSQPFIVLAAIPFGFVGAVIGHMITGHTLTILSMFGLVALTGVVVNDSLVLVDFVNRRRRAGTPLPEAVRDAAASRFRPILLTSLTTFGGLTPLLLERSVQAKFLIPMGVALGFGVMFATGITLILVPAIYYILEDIKALFGRRRRDENLTALRSSTEKPVGVS